MRLAWSIVVIDFDIVYLRAADDLFLQARWNPRPRVEIVQVLLNDDIAASGEVSIFVADVADHGTLALQPVAGLGYPVAVITLPSGKTHTFITGPYLVPKLERLASDLLVLEHRAAVIRFAGSMAGQFAHDEVQRLQDVGWDRFVGVIARWACGHHDEARTLLKSGS